MAGPDPFVEIGAPVLRAEPMTLPLFADARFCVLTPEEPRGLRRATESRRNGRPKHPASLAYRWLLTEALVGRPHTRDDLYSGDLHLHLGVDVPISRRMSAELAAISADDPEPHLADEAADMVDVSRATMFNWRAQSGFRREADWWRDFFRRDPDAQFPLFRVYAQRLLDETGDAPETILARATAALPLDALSARVVIHDFTYWYAERQVRASEELLVALGVALGMVDGVTGRPDLQALWATRYPKILRDEAVADGLSLTSQGRLRSTRELDTEEHRKQVADLRKLPAYRIIMDDAVSPKGADSIGRK